MLRQGKAWSGALIVMAVTAVLVVLDLSDASVHRYWSRHAFTASVLSGVLVLLLTVLIVDRVTHVRQVRNQSRAVAAQAAIIVGQATRTVDAVKRTSASEEAKEQAGDQLRTYTQMLLTSAPVLIDAERPRAFLETAQRLAAELIAAMRDGRDAAARLDRSLQGLRTAEDPLIAALTSQERAAISSVASDSSDG